MGKIPRVRDLPPAYEPAADDDGLPVEPQPHVDLNHLVQLTATFAAERFREAGAKYVVVGLNPDTGAVIHASNLPPHAVVDLLREAADAIAHHATKAVPFIPFLSRQLRDDPMPEPSPETRGKVAPRAAPAISFDTEHVSDVVGDRELLERLIKQAEGVEDDDTDG